jgi:predicted MFS family arabinose efflux permease
MSSNAPSFTAKTLRRARWATRSQFAALGLLMGAWGAHVPSVKRAYGLDEAGVAGVLLAGALGAVLALLVAGRIVARLGVRRSCAAAGFCLAALLAGVLLWPHALVLLLAMLCFGAASSVLDVAINAEGTTLESLGGRAVMSQLHGLFSVGGMLGAALCAALFRVGWSPVWQLSLLGLLAAGLVAAGLPGLLPDPAHHQEPSASSEAGRRLLPRGPLLLIGLLIMAGMTAEGVMYDWSVLYLKESLGQAQDRAALGYAAFSAAMAATRLGGDWLRERFDPIHLLRSGALLSGGAMLTVLLIGQAGVALGGFVLVGMGLALVVPMLFNAAAQVPGTQRASAIAAVSSIGYAGFLMGPPLIGGLAKVWSLPLALGVVVLACATLAWGAGQLQSRLKPT